MTRLQKNGKAKTAMAWTSMAARKGGIIRDGEKEVQRVTASGVTWELF